MVAGWPRFCWCSTCRTFYRLANGIWSTSDQAQGPLILMIVLYLFWKQRDYLYPTAEQRTWSKLGALVFGSRLAVLRVVGARSQDILMFRRSGRKF